MHQASMTTLSEPPMSREPLPSHSGASEPRTVGLSTPDTQHTPMAAISTVRPLTFGASGAGVAYTPMLGLTPPGG